MISLEVLARYLWERYELNPTPLCDPKAGLGEVAPWDQQGKRIVERWWLVAQEMCDDLGIDYAASEVAASLVSAVATYHATKVRLSTRLECVREAMRIVPAGDAVEVVAVAQVLWDFVKEPAPAP